MNTAITGWEQRGWLSYDSGNMGMIYTVPGWFMLSSNGHFILRRKVGGRNCHTFVTADRVVKFRLDAKAK